MRPGTRRVVIAMIAQDIIDSLKFEEGFSAHYYRDILGHASIGYGRCIADGVGLGITKNEAEILLRNDVARTVKELRNNFRWFRNAPEPQQNVLIEVCFQLGLPTFKKFKRMLHALEREDYKRAAEELLDSRYAQQCPGRVGRYAERLDGYKAFR